MIGQVDVLGLYLPWLMPLSAAALVTTWLLRRGLLALGAYRWVWHPALFDLALFVLVLAGVGRVSLLLLQ